MTLNATVPRLVVTLGPRSWRLEGELVNAGAEAFRLNASHLDETGLARAIGDVRRAAPETPVIVDLQGAKMRLGAFAPRPVGAGETLEVVFGDATPGRAVPLPHAEPFSTVRVGDAIAIDDGKLQTTVCRVGLNVLELLVHNDGLLEPRKGFNRAEHPVRLNNLTPRDAAQARVALEMGCRLFALSFVIDGQECGWLRSVDAGIRVIAKIERPDAIGNIRRIAASADTIWICRGDLGVQVGELELGRCVAAIEPRELGCPTLMAGQVLEHLTEHASPTRSELCHVSDLGIRGYAGIVLSDETAVGKDPVGATRWAAQLTARAFG